MRQNEGDTLRLFNGKDGEWLVEIEALSKKFCVGRVKEQLRHQENSLDIWAVFAPIKKTRMDFAVEKATELGVNTIWPVITQYCDRSKIKKERMEAQVIEAAEQCERLDIPEIRDTVSLSKLLELWPEDRMLIVCAEFGEVEPVASVFNDIDDRSIAVLIGPEGGFSVEELDKLSEYSFVKKVSLGGRILRAETALCAVLSCYQAIAGDWVKKA